MNPFDFAARMWNHAPGMLVAQEEAMGEQIILTGQELADLIAFVHDEEVQHTFTEADLSPEAQTMMDHKHGGVGPPRHMPRSLGIITKGIRSTAIEMAAPVLGPPASPALAVIAAV